MQEPGQKQVVETVGAAEHDEPDTMRLERVDDSIQLRFLGERNVVAAEQLNAYPCPLRSARRSDSGRRTVCGVPDECRFRSGRKDRLFLVCRTNGRDVARIVEVHRPVARRIVRIAGAFLVYRLAPLTGSRIDSLAGSDPAAREPNPAGRHMRSRLQREWQPPPRRWPRSFR